MILGKLYRPRSKNVPGALREIDAFLRKGGHGQVDLNACEWRPEVWRSKSPSATFIAIHPNDMEQFWTPVAPGAVRDTIAAAIDESARGQLVPFDAWLREHPQEQIWDGVLGCFALMCRRTVLFFWSDGRIGEAGLWPRVEALFDAWGMQKDRHYFDMQGGGDPKMWAAFDWPGFVAARPPRPLCEFFLDPDHVYGLLRSLLPMDVLCQGTMNPEAKPMPFFRRDGEGGPCWFVYEEFLPGADEMQPFSWSTSLVERLGHFAGPNDRESIRSSLDVGKHAGAIRQLTPADADDDRIVPLGSLRLLWELTKVGGESTRLPEPEMRDSVLAQSNNHLRLAKMAHREYQYLADQLVGIVRRWL